MTALLLLVFTIAILAVVLYDWRDALQLRRLAINRAPNGAKQLDQDSAGWNAPTVDIVIPIYNMGRTFERTLASIERSSYSRRRIIVVDDGSDDGVTPPLLSRLANRIDVIGTISHAGKAAAVNHGLSLGDGDVVLVLDADSYVRSDFIEVSLSELGAAADAVDFVQQVSNPEASFWTRQAAFERAILTLRPDNFGALFAIRRPVFERLRFRDCSAPQYEINERLRAGGRLRISPEPVVFSDEPTSWRRAYRRKRRWVYGWLETRQSLGGAWDFHVLMPFLDMLLLAAPLFAPWLPELAFFPVALWLFWTVKSLWLARLLGVAPMVAVGYPVYMLMLLLAAVEAVIRFCWRRPVAWS